MLLKAVHMKSLTIFLIGTSLTGTVVAEEIGSGSIVQHEVVQESESYRPEPQKVYVESADGTYRSTREDEYCFYNEERNQIRCYAEDPAHSPVVREERTVYRSTRTGRQHHYRQGLSTGLGVGLAIGVPILIHNSLDRHRYQRHYGYYGHGYRGHKHYRKGWRHGRYYQHSRKYDGYGKHRRKYDYRY